MLNRDELREIASMNGKESRYVSLYLNVDPLLNRGGDYDVHFKNMITNAVESLDKAVYKKVSGDIEKIKDYVASHRRSFRKGLVILSSEENDFWKVYHLNVPVKNEVVIDTSPYTKPLLDVLDTYEKYAVLLVEKEDARIFVVHLGEIVEYEEVHTGGVPGKHRREGGFALSQMGIDRHMAQTGKGRAGITGYREHHIERHIAEHVKLHLKDVLEVLNPFLEREHINRLIVGGSDEATAATISMLHETTRAKVIGTTKAEMFLTSDEVLRRVESVVAAYERKQEEAAVESLITQALSGANAVLGLADVLTMLQERRVMKLVMLKDLKASGYQCGSCGLLTAQQIEPCPVCSGKMDQISDITDLIGELAVQQGAIVEMIADNKRLAEKGGIGAFLRF
ncbi:MAG: hypothetical protein ACOYW7_03950 [Nitrospirota bacterium]